MLGKRVDWVGLLVVACMAALGAFLGAWWLVGVLMASAYVLGRYVESRVWVELERERARTALESFSDWAELTLAAAPDELEPEAEAFRRDLQGRYHEAQALLDRLNRKR